MAYDNSNRGSIWRNEKKSKDADADFTGSLNIYGKDYFVNAWRRKEGASEKSPALSFSIKPKAARSPTFPSKRGVWRGPPGVSASWSDVPRQQRRSAVAARG